MGWVNRDTTEIIATRPLNCATECEFLRTFAQITHEITVDIQWWHSKRAIPSTNECDGAVISIETEKKYSFQLITICAAVIIRPICESLARIENNITIIYLFVR